MISSSLGTYVQILEARMRDSGGPPSDWVVGVAEDPERALYRSHRVDPDTKDAVWLKADTPIAARAVAHYFHDLGCLGRALWDDRALGVYAYRRAPGTWP